jgi:hypothetical protein
MIKLNYFDFEYFHKKNGASHKKQKTRKEQIFAMTKTNHIQRGMV